MKRLARFGGMLIGIGAGMVGLLWLLKDRLMGPEAVPVTPEEAPRFRVAPATQVTADSQDDLSQVKGIGPVFRARLGEAGVSTFADLARADAEALATRIDVAASRVDDWVDQARRLDGN